MSYLKYTAPRIHTITQGTLESHVVITDEQGKIMAIEALGDHDLSTVMMLDGDIVPGFVNTHCHLELSHMKGRVDTGTKLLPFLKNVVSFRDIAQEEINQAIVAGDQEMYDGGIVAVGDISNKLDTAATKNSSKLRYYTFVEMFDFMQDFMTQGTIEQYLAVYAEQSSTKYNKISQVPHAPYTVSRGLFEYLATANKKGSTVSIHNQETREEDALFMHKKGGFLEFYKGFGFSLDHFDAIGQHSIYYAMEYLDRDNKNLFVHNTLTTAEDIANAHAWSDNVYWATCPNANLYIENALPNYQAFIENDARLTIGTDSLTSNWQLSILEEMKTIQKYQSYVSSDQLLKWATINGAHALSYNDELGSIEQGKTPGLVLIENATLKNGNLQFKDAKVRRLI